MSLLFTAIIWEYLSAMLACGWTISPGSPFNTALREWQADRMNRKQNAEQVNLKLRLNFMI